MPAVPFQVSASIVRNVGQMGFQGLCLSAELESKGNAVLGHDGDTKLYWIPGEHSHRAMHEKAGGVKNNNNKVEKKRSSRVNEDVSHHIFYFYSCLNRAAGCGVYVSEAIKAFWSSK